MVRTHLASRAVLIVVALGSIVSTLTPPTVAAAADQRPGPSGRASTAEVRSMSRENIRHIIEVAEPAELPVDGGRFVPGELEERGQPMKVEGALPDISTAGSTTTVTAEAASTTGSTAQVWPGAYNTNPNRQVGRLYYDILPGASVKWNVCTATVINTANASTLVTAGHCVYQPDPDGNGYAGTNGYNYESFQFCPGFEYTCKLGVWNYRRWATTSGWAYGNPSTKRVSYTDDFAILLMKPNEKGNIRDVVGGQGITFNQPVNVWRTSLGYPVAYDERWPNERFNDGDLYYTQDVDDYGSGQVRIDTSMIGGASGGPWLSWVNDQWMGYVNSVNSNKGCTPGCDYFMYGPYFGDAEKNLFNYWKAL